MTNCVTTGVPDGARPNPARVAIPVRRKESGQVMRGLGVVHTEAVMRKIP